MGDSVGTADVLAVAAAHVVATAADAGVENRRLALDCVAHHLACSLAGARLPWSRSAHAVLAGDAGPGQPATVVGTAHGSSVGPAVFVNAVTGQSTLAEDVHPASLLHAGSVVGSVALALAEARGASGRQLLDAMVAGYDVGCHVGAGLKTPEFVARGFRPSGVFAPIAAAATAAALLDLDADRTASALGIAANAAGGLREWAYGGTTDIYVHNGFGARNGYEAALLAAAGITGPAGALTGAAGAGVAYSGGTVDWSAVGAALDGASALTEIRFKRFPACSGVQSGIELAVALRKAHDLVAEDVERVVLYTHEHGKHNPGCDSAGPWTDVGQAQMSNQLGIAIALSRPQVGVAEYLSYRDPELLELAARVDVVERDELTARYPAASAAAAEVWLKDGSRVSGEIADGSALGRDEVWENLAHTLSDRYAPAAAERLRGAVAGLADASDLGELTSALRDIRPRPPS